MTPIQIIMLAHQMRQAQKAVQASLMDRYRVMAELEDQFDAAIIPYLNYHRAIELQEADHDS